MEKGIRYNTFGMISHYTDDLIPWSLRKNNAKETAIKLRKAYDKIYDAGLEEEFELLREFIYDKALDDELDCSF